MTFGTRILHGAREREWAQQSIRDAPPLSVVTIEPPRASWPQKKRMNAMCGEVAKQVPWHGQMLEKDDWRHIFAAALFKLRIVPNLEGDGFVTLTPSTTKMTRDQMSNMIDLIAEFGARHSVVFSDE